MTLIKAAGLSARQLVVASDKDRQIMCGGHELHHLIRTLTPDSTAHPVNEAQEIRLMYARGDIDTDTFKRLFAAAREGYLGHEDVVRIVYGTQPGTAAEAETDLGEHSLETDGPLLDLEKHLAHLLTQAQNAESAAQRPGLTEEQVRAYLETKQGALFRAKAVQQEIAVLQGSNDKSHS